CHLFEVISFSSFSQSPAPCFYRRHTQLIRRRMAAIRTSPRRKEKAPFLASLPALATQQLVRFRSRVSQPAALTPRLAPEHCYPTTGIQIRRSALPRFYSILPAKPTLLSEWTPF